MRPSLIYVITNKMISEAETSHLSILKMTSDKTNAAIIMTNMITNHLLTFNYSP